MIGTTQNILLTGKCRLSISNKYVYATGFDKWRTLTYACLTLIIIAAIYCNQTIADRTDI